MGVLFFFFFFQIDVENPCVIMSQDKSREFLHSGNAKDKFKVNSLDFQFRWLYLKEYNFPVGRILLYIFYFSSFQSSVIYFMKH